ncbi:hypothetical protein PanWU01x14_046790 [Parasponia andersonii]|uniref:Uncharacterized protein n=1 Tax=Parasponia andersonii TaxID=3476 RepID=A0A2P5DNU5_PARAD|nr:hypothetical protein PanWU01x14_046790 [Parasponia andersonii]
MSSSPPNLQSKDVPQGSSPDPSQEFHNIMKLLLKRADEEANGVLIEDFVTATHTFLKSINKLWEVKEKKIEETMTNMNKILNVMRRFT